MTRDRESERAQLRTLLHERGVNWANSLVEELHDGDLDPAFVAIAWWDDLPKSGPRAATPGLLVKTIRDGGVPGYKRPHERTGVDARAAPNMTKAIRGALLSPDGMSREEARMHYAEVAGRLNTPVDALLDSAVGMNWTVTPRHPALQYDQPGQTSRYALWVRGDCGGKPDPECKREPGEDYLAWSMRFWGWADPLVTVGAADENPDDPDDVWSDA